MRRARERDHEESGTTLFTRWPKVISGADWMVSPAPNDTAPPAAKRMLRGSLAESPQCAPLISALLDEAARIDEKTAHTPAYANYRYRTARDVYYWACGQANIYPGEWHGTFTHTNTLPDPELLLLQALCVKQGLPPPSPTPRASHIPQAATRIERATAFATTQTNRSLHRNAGRPLVAPPRLMTLADLTTAADAEAEADADRETVIVAGQGATNTRKAPDNPRSKQPDHLASRATGGDTPEVLHGRTSLDELRYEDHGVAFLPTTATHVHLTQQYHWFAQVNKPIAADRKQKNAAGRKPPRAMTCIDELDTNDQYA